LVLTQQAPQNLSPRQMAALNNLTEAQNKAVFADHASGGWHKVTENDQTTTGLEENVTAEVATEVATPTADVPQPFELAASLEHLRDASDALVDEYAAKPDEELPEGMAQGDTDVTEDVPAFVAADFGHDDLAALVE